MTTTSDNDSPLPKICPFCEHVIDHCIVEVCEQHAEIDAAIASQGGGADPMTLTPLRRAVLAQERARAEAAALAMMTPERRAEALAASKSTATPWIKTGAGYWERDIGPYNLTVDESDRCKWEVTYCAENVWSDHCVSADEAKAAAVAWATEKCATFARDLGMRLAP
mgnify:CR=1 FL=1